MLKDLKVNDVLNLKELKSDRHFHVEGTFPVFRNVKTMSWGAHAFTQAKGEWLRMKVEARRHKGHIYILLAANDTFTVLYTTTRGRIQKIETDVYIDCLIDTIDREIEYVEAYGR